MRQGFAVIIAALAVTAGCGGDDGGGAGEGSAPSDKRAAVVEATKEYQDAFLEEDASAVCDRLTGSGKEEVVTTAAMLGGAVGCEESVKRIFDLGGEDDRLRVKQSRDELEPGDVRVQGKEATVTLPASGRELGLQRVGDEWLVSAPGLQGP